MGGHGVINESYFGGEPFADQRIDPSESSSKRQPGHAENAAKKNSVDATKLPNYRDQLAKLDQARDNLETRYHFDASKYGEQQSRDNIAQLTNDLVEAGVPKWIVQKGLQQAERNLGRRGFRDWRHWHHQKAVDNSVIQNGIDRMKALLEPAAKVADRLQSAEAVLPDLKQELLAAEKKLSGPQERLKNFAGYTPETKYAQQAHDDLRVEVEDLEADVALLRQAVEETEKEIKELKGVLHNIDGDQFPSNHQTRIQDNLNIVGSSKEFGNVLAKQNPGDSTKGFGGTLSRMELSKSTKKQALALGTLSGSQWYTAIKSQDKARRLVFAQKEMPTPTARMMAAVLRFDRSVPL